MSAVTSNQVIAFVLGVLVAFGFTAAGLPIVGDTLTGIMGQSVGDSLANFSILDQFDGLNRGVVEARALIFFTSFIAAWLAVTTLLIDGKRRVG